MSSTLLVRIIANTKDLLQGLQDAEGKLSGFGSAAKKAAGLAAGAFSGMQIGSYLMDATKAAADEAQEMALLDQALKKNAGATDNQVKSVEKWITAQQNALAFSDGELRPALGELVRAGRSVEQSQGDLGVAMDIARAKGLDLSTVTKAMAKAAMGSETALSRLGIKTKDAADKTLSYDQILQEASKTMGGQAKTAADTAAGRAEIFKNRMADLKETIGEKLLPIFDQLVKGLNGIVGWFQRLGPTTQTIILVMAGLAAAALVLVPIIGALGIAINAATWPVLAVIAVIALLVAGFVLAYKKSETFRNIVNSVASWFTDTLVPAIKEGIAWLQEKLAPVFARVAEWILEKWKVFQSWWNENWPRIKTIIQANIDAIALIISTVVTWIMKFWDKFGDNIMTVIEGAFDVVKNVVMFVINLIGGIISVFLAVISGDWAGAWNAIKETTSELLGNVVGIFGGIFKQIKGIIGGAWDGIKDIFGKGFDFIIGLPGRLFDFASKLAEIFTNAAKGAINGLIGWIEKGINGVIGGINKVTSNLPFGSFKLNDISIPRLADGGIVNRATLALIGEAGPEAVVPLSKLGSMGSNGAPINVTINTVAGDPVAIERMVVEALTRARRRGTSGIAV